MFNYIAQTNCNTNYQKDTLLIHLFHQEIDGTVLFTDKLKMGKRVYRTWGTLREPHYLRLIYRRFEILHENIMGFIGIFFDYLSHWIYLFTSLLNKINFSTVKNEILLSHLKTTRKTI